MVFFLSERYELSIKCAKIQGKTKVKTQFFTKNVTRSKEALHYNFLNDSTAYCIQILKNLGIWLPLRAKKNQISHETRWI